MNKLKTKDFMYSSIFAAVISVLGFLVFPLPFSPVPVTGQSLGIMLAGCLLTTRQAAMAVGTFLLIGIAGVPVFAGGTAGIGILLGPRGGYLIGFLVGAIIISILKKRFNSVIGLGFANVIGGIVVVYLFGVLWLNWVTGMGIQAAFAGGALPFIPGDIFKAVLASIVGYKVNKRMEDM